MSSRVCVIDLPGLSRSLLQYVPVESAFGKWMHNRPVSTLESSWPAVTCSVQATLTTGTPPATHGIVANGIPTLRSTSDQETVDASNFAEYRRQVSFWEQSNQFLQAPRFWQDANGKSRYKTSLLFFQHCMPGFSGTLKPAADIVLTPKPDHGPDGKLTSLCWSHPPELVPLVFKKLGLFPLMNYWGPMAGLASSAWIAKSASIIWDHYQPQLQMVYVPHLDYDLQRFGPDSAQAKKAMVDVAGALEPLFRTIERSDGKLMVLSEYSIISADRSIPVNRLLKDAGFLRVRSTADGDLIDYEASDAWALVDHQIAHVYLRTEALKAKVAYLLAQHSGIMVVERSSGLDHPRAGDLQLHASGGLWFDYRWWTHSNDAPVFARMVDIHRKPGYDPLELFLEHGTRSISNDATQIKGTHGSVPECHGILIGAGADQRMQMTDVSKLIELALA